MLEYIHRLSHTYLHISGYVSISKLAAVLNLVDIYYIQVPVYNLHRPAGVPHVYHTTVSHMPYARHPKHKPIKQLKLR